MHAAPGHHMIDDEEELGWAARTCCIAAGLAFLALSAFLAAHILRASTVDITVIGLTILTGAGLLLLALGLRQLGDGGLWSTSGLFYAGAALVILLEPFFRLHTLTLALAILLATSGVARLVIGVRERIQWVLLSGCVSIMVGTVIGMDWPRDSLRMIGGLVAVDLAAQGLALILSGFGHRFAILEEEEGDD